MQIHPLTPKEINIQFLKSKNFYCGQDIFSPFLDRNTRGKFYKRTLWFDPIVCPLWNKAAMVQPTQDYTKSPSPSTLTSNLDGLWFWETLFESFPPEGVYPIAFIKFSSCRLFSVKMYVWENPRQLKKIMRYCTKCIPCQINYVFQD